MEHTRLSFSSKENNWFITYNQCDVLSSPINVLFPFCYAITQDNVCIVLYNVLSRIIHYHIYEWRCFVSLQWQMRNMVHINMGLISRHLVAYSPSSKTSSPGTFVYIDLLVDVRSQIRTFENCFIVIFIVIVQKNIPEFEIIDSKNSSTAYVILYEMIDTWFLDSNGRVGVWSLPWRWHILSIHPIDNRSRNRRRNLWVGWCVSSWWLCSRPEALC